ncbi:diaminobutyrate acetyltransferase [Pusillimonas sp. MFBS29]|uniref:diaminobutyrate acetyltransferase n=1 Tax=Pusillimonas sp. MFBS29 TaxID=2886690 RepID=UPI001D118FA8|nr:diaminobutyrate acetyltransferase [Pusillimonas sp. MFBS29]MCC2597504.1 diaminobutyrate acetyltransferase [Pusillimonas sp. MFBS29]
MRQPHKADAADIHRLISECPPLDLNSVYTYLLLSEYFGATCVLAGDNDTLLGFVSGYVPPERPDTLFVWQVAVHERARGQSLGRRMLQSLLQRPALAHIQYLETTVGPDNRASRAMFGGLARKLLAPVNEQPLFERHMFGEHAHEDEPLLRIGPFTSTSLP